MAAEPCSGRNRWGQDLSVRSQIRTFTQVVLWINIWTHLVGGKTSNRVIKEKHEDHSLVVSVQVVFSLNILPLYRQGSQ